MNNKVRIGIISLICLVTALLVGLTSNNVNTTPIQAYQVYLDGKVIGIIDSKEKLENYIDTKQQQIKEEYKVDTVYKPNGLEIKEFMTYQSKIDKVEDIYNLIKEEKPFTIKGYVVTIKQKDNDVLINILEKEVFEEALTKTIETFVNKEEYKAYLDDTQPAIKDVGKIIEQISITEEITIREAYIDSDDLIFTDIGLLSKYIMFGTLEEQEKYTVTALDNMEDIAFKHNLSKEEFLVANPEFTSINNSLYLGQQVNIGLIKPQVKIKVIEHVVEDKEQLYKTEIVYDHNMLVGTSYVKVSGENGVVRTTSKVETVNGKKEAVLPVENTVLKQTINQVVVKGGKVVPTIGDNSYWAWPTKTPYTITSGYGPRWGSFHDGIDIAGTGYGSPIYSGNNGTVQQSSYTSTNGHYIIINHNNGYYSIYAHLSARYVEVGQVIERGQVIGGMGNSGFVLGSTGTHLHYGIWRGKPYGRGSYHINPYTFY